jgi:TonB family protein
MSAEQGMPKTGKFGRILAFGASLGAHGAAYASLSARPVTVHREPPPSSIDFELSPPPKAPALPVPEEPAPKAPAKPTTLAAQSKPAAPTRPLLPRTPATSTTTSAAPELSGVTLTDESSEGPAMPSGDGSAAQGPIGLGSSQVPHAAVAFVPPVIVPSQPTLVAVRDLREHPRPPALSALLRENYPDEARQRGLRGTASVRARIDADGVIRKTRLLNETAAGFGAACQRTVTGSHWSAPRDKNGSAVATEIVYTCHFEVDQ